MRNEAQWRLSDKLHAFLKEHVYASKYADWEMKEIRDKARQATHGDLEFIRGKQAAYVDEKAYSSVWDGCLVEVIQDVETKDLGWLFTLDSCTHLICGYYATKDGAEPKWVYKIEWKAVKDTYLYLCEKDSLPHRVTNRGYGKTIFAVVPWRTLAGHMELLWPPDRRLCSCGAVALEGGTECKDCHGANSVWDK